MQEVKMVRIIGKLYFRKNLGPVGYAHVFYDLNAQRSKRYGSYDKIWWRFYRRKP